MKKLFNEFREFINRGSVVDLAVGVMIGAAFKAIVDSLVNDVISPLLGIFGKNELADYVWNVGGVSIGWGSFVSAVINFLIMAFILMMLVKAINRVSRIGKKKEEAAAPAQPQTRQCPFCLEQIPAGATRCPHCTSELPKEE